MRKPVYLREGNLCTWLESHMHLVTIPHCHGPFESYPQHYYMLPGLLAQSALPELHSTRPNAFFPTVKMTNSGSRIMTIHLSHNKSAGSERSSAAVLTNPSIKLAPLRDEP